MRYARIEDGTVANIIEVSVNAEDYPDCIPADDRAVQIGDVYQDGEFLRDGKVVKSAMELLADVDARRQDAENVIGILLGADGN